MGPFALEECHRVYFDPNLKILSFYGIRKLLLCYGLEFLRYTQITPLLWN